MCVNCIRSQVDITEGIQKQVTLLWCKECERYLQPPKHWVKAALESKELLTLCIKRLKGLQKVGVGSLLANVAQGLINLHLGTVMQTSLTWWACLEGVLATNDWAAVQVKLVDAGFVWTEPHSRRIKVKLTVQAEVMNGAILQQTFVVDFVQSVVPARYRSDKQLVSHNEHSATYNYKYTFSVELVPICRDDLVCLPQKAAAALGGFGPLALCTRVSNTLTLTDPQTLRQVQMDAVATDLSGPLLTTFMFSPTKPLALQANQYWRQPYEPVLNSRQLVEFVVLDVDAAGQPNGRYVLADVQVAKASDLGRNDRTSFVRTHLGHLLHPGDNAVGYDMSTSNVVNPDLEAAADKGFATPDVILVRDLTFMHSIAIYSPGQRDRDRDQAPIQLWSVTLFKSQSMAQCMLHFNGPPTPGCHLGLVA
ncbi:MAG: hypothetical protein MMC33_004274 [Icmadophila ericetorum]|nr:hypothetical protein [Icmadophila ericetorum]